MRSIVNYEIIIRPILFDKQGLNSCFNERTKGTIETAHIKYRSDRGEV